ncbi:MAG: hypothetical protein K0V04_21010 [Deltaproteobacteria bacterium]|nr:hypothetical protein [Deltaproteobacteria bacterium]
MLCKSLIPVATAVVLSIATPAAAGPVEDLQPGHWLELANTPLIDAEKKPSDYADFNGNASASYDSYQRNLGVDAVVAAWSGGTMDIHGDRLIVWGGGHNGYGGNELYAFELDTLTWNRLTDPTVDPNRCAVANADGTPTSRHTYGGVTYIAHAGQLFASGGAWDCDIGGCGQDDVWTFDFNSTQWQQRSPAGDAINPYCEAKSVYDPVTSHVYFHAHGWWDYDVDADTLTARPSFNNWDNVSMALDPINRTVVEIGDGRATMFDLDAPDRMGVDLDTTGVEVIRSASNPGLVYDDVLGRIVAWPGGPDVYSLDTATLTWEVHPPAADNVDLPSTVTASGGTYGRFGYSPARNIYILVNAVDDNVMLYKLAPGAGTPPPDPSDPGDPDPTDDGGDDSDSGDDDGTGSPSDGGTDGGRGDTTAGGASDTGIEPGTGDAGPSADPEDATVGCSCRTQPSRGALPLFLLAIVIGGRRRRYAQRAGHGG